MSDKTLERIAVALEVLNTKIDQLTGQTPYSQQFALRTMDGSKEKPKRPRFSNG